MSWGMYSRYEQRLLGDLQVARAGDLADWLVRKSMMHPANRDLPVLTDMVMGGYREI